MNQKQKIEELKKEIKKLKTEKTYLICTLDDFIVKCEDTTRTIPLRHKKYNCVLCGKRVKDYGHNPYPIKDKGRCCNDCNSKVIEERIKSLR